MHVHIAHESKLPQTLPIWQRLRRLRKSRQILADKCGPWWQKQRHISQSKSPTNGLLLEFFFLLFSSHLPFRSDRAATHVHVFPVYGPIQEGEWACAHNMLVSFMSIERRKKTSKFPNNIPITSFVTKCTHQICIHKHRSHTHAQ